MTITEFLLARIVEDEATLKRWSRGVLDPEISEIEKRWQPERVLAECKAKRELVLWLDDDPLCHDGGWAYVDHVLQSLASVYSDHPDYRKEWA